MANNQSLPNLNESKSGFINTNVVNNVVAPDYKEQKWATVAQIGNGIVGVSNAYKNMKHTEMLAKMDNLAQQNLHKLSDATDPCQLPDLINEANKSYDDLFKDDPYGKSFYQSDAYNNFRIKNEANIQKTVNALNHKFNTIQAVATGNEISSDIALMNDPARMSQALKGFESMLSRMELTAEEKFEIMSTVAKNSFGKAFTNDPNMAVAWYDYSQGMYDKYGVDGAEIKLKAKNYNKTLQSEKLTLENKLAQAKKREEDAQLESLKYRARMGGDLTALQKEADKISARVGNLFYKATQEDDLTSNLQKKEISEIFSAPDLSDEQKIEQWQDYKVAHPEITSEARAYGNDVGSDIETESSFTAEQLETLHNIEIGDNNITAKDAYNKYKDNPKFLEKVFAAIRTRNENTKKEAEKTEEKTSKSNALRLENLAKNGNIKEALDGLGKTKLRPEEERQVWIAIFDKLEKLDKNKREKQENILVQRALNSINDGYRFNNKDLEQLSGIVSAESMSKIRGHQEQAIKEEKTAVENRAKEADKTKLNAAELDLINAQNIEELYKVMGENVDLSPDNYSQLITDFNTKKEKFEAENKSKFVEDTKVAQNKMLESLLQKVSKNQIPNEESMLNLSTMLRPEQMTTLRNAISKREKDINTANNNQLTSWMYEVWEKGNLVNPKTVENFKDLTEEDTRILYDKIITKNKEVAQKSYDKQYANIQSAIWDKKYSPSDEDIREWSVALSSYGIKSEAEIYKELQEMANAKNLDVSKEIEGLHTELENLWLPVSNKESDIEKIAKSKAKQAIYIKVKNGDKVNVADIVKRFRPTTASLMEFENDTAGALNTLEAQRESIFEYDEDKKNDWTKGWSLDVDIDNIGEVLDFHNRVKFARQQEYITEGKAAELLTPLRLKQSEIIETSLKKPNLVIGYIMNKVKSSVKNIKDGDLIDITSGSLNMLLSHGVRYNNSIQDRFLRPDTDILNKSQLDILNTIIDENIGLKYNYGKVNSDIIVLTDGTEIENGSKNNGTKSN